MVRHGRSVMLYSTVGIGLLNLSGPPIGTGFVFCRSGGEDAYPMGGHELPA